MKKITIGIIADVDAGKTTLSEAMLYLSGSIRSFGRVDKGDSFLDNNELERRRGITIFSKQARLSFGDSQIVLIDTPGHADFSAETERTLTVLDYALLIISAPEGISGQTKLLWKLLKEYKVPAFVFFNKMDMALKNDPDAEGVKSSLLADLNAVSGGTALDFTVLSTLQGPGKDEGKESEAAFYDSAAMCSESAMEEYLETGAVSDDTLKSLIRDGALTPAFFGSASRQEGVELLLSGLDTYTEERSYPTEFSARVYKIARDPDGNRLTFVKITGGEIKVRSSVRDNAIENGSDANDGENVPQENRKSAGNESRITQIRFYSGEKYTTAESAAAGDICTLTGLKNTRAGTTLGTQDEIHEPLLTPVLSYRVLTGSDAAEALPLMRILEEESPELTVEWEESRKEIHVHVMGTVQLEILTSLLKERFGITATFDSGEVLYKETIQSPVIGAGHFEPLRHYAEVHLLMEPLERGAGLAFESKVSTDRLARNWQRLILTHLAEKRHKGVLTGAPITDMKITVIAGRAHLKHTEGGDFRQATYRAVRQGLMMAENLLLEPFYRFSIEIPTENVGRVLSDLDRMNAEFSSPDLNQEGMSVVEGRGPVAALKDYPAALASFSKNRGSIHFIPDGFGECHNAAEVIASKGYDPLSDLRNTPDSVFCANGSGVIVPYNEVWDHLDVEFDGTENEEPDTVTAKGGRAGEALLSGKEIDSIIAAYASANKGKKKGNKKKNLTSAGNEGTVRPSGGKIRSGERGASVPFLRTRTYFPFEKAEILLVDGYNVIFAWPELNALAKDSIDAARDALIDSLSKYSAMVEAEVIAVFDAYRVKGKAREETTLGSIRLVFTKEDETADQYIEKFANGEGRHKRLAVVTSDAAEQQITHGQGGMILSSREFKSRLDEMVKKLNEDYGIL